MLDRLTPLLPSATSRLGSDVRHGDGPARERAGPTPVLSRITPRERTGRLATR